MKHRYPGTGCKEIVPNRDLRYPSTRHGDGGEIQAASAFDSPARISVPMLSAILEPEALTDSFAKMGVAGRCLDLRVPE